MKQNIRTSLVVTTYLLLAFIIFFNIVFIYISLFRPPGTFLRGGLCYKLFAHSSMSNVTVCADTVLEV